MIGVSSDKAEHFLECLNNGKPILRPQNPAGWTVFDMLALAGACFFASLSHGPPHFEGTDWTKAPGERREAIKQDYLAQFHGAIEFLGHPDEARQRGDV